MTPPPQLLPAPSHYRTEVELLLIVSTLHSKVEEQLIRHTTMFLEMSSAGISEVPEPPVYRMVSLRVRMGCFCPDSPK